MADGLKRAFAAARATRKIRHMADKIDAAGSVSALCYLKPHPINLRKASWTNRPEAVTCYKCRAALAAAPGEK